MRLTCPACGAIASAEAWQNDAAARSALDLALKLPGIVQPLLLPYLGLFRRGGKGLAWSRALKIMRELHDLIDTGSVQWDGGETRPAPPQLWAAAMQATIKRAPKGLDNHNYLRRTCWEMAAGAAAQSERERENAARGRVYEQDEQPCWPENAVHSAPLAYEPASDADRAEMRRMMRQFLNK